MADRFSDGTQFLGFEAIPIAVHVRAGTTRISLSHLSAIEPGEVLPLDRRVGQPFELRAGSVRLGRVEPVVDGEGVGVKLLAAGENDDAGR